MATWFVNAPKVRKLGLVGTIFRCFKKISPCITETSEVEMATDRRKVLYSYQARSVSEITIHENEDVEIISEGKIIKFIFIALQKIILLDTKHGEGWFLGMNSSGEFGLFPKSYVSSPEVEELVDEAKRSFGDLPSSDLTDASEFHGMKIQVLSSYVPTSSSHFEYMMCSAKIFGEKIIKKCPIEIFFHLTMFLFTIIGYYLEVAFLSFFCSIKCIVAKSTNSK